MAEFMNTITMSAVVVTLFLGGPDGPTAHVFILSWIIPVLWFLGKTLLFLFLYVWLRAALPRLRYDQLMDLGWKVLIPLSLGWVLVLAAFLVSRWWGFGVIAALFVVGGLLVRSIVVGAEVADSIDADPDVGADGDGSGGGGPATGPPGTSGPGAAPALRALDAPGTVT